MVAGKTKIQTELIAFFRSRCRRRSIWELYEDEDEYENEIFSIEKHCVYRKRQTWDSNWELLKIENEKIKTA